MQVTETTFWDQTMANFTLCNAPDIEPDRSSESSKYWFTDEGVIRQSNHWGTNIEGNDWFIEGSKRTFSRYDSQKQRIRTGYCKFEDFEFKRISLPVTTKLTKQYNFYESNVFAKHYSAETWVYSNRKRKYYKVPFTIVTGLDDEQGSMYIKYKGLRHFYSFIYIDFQDVLLRDIIVKIDTGWFIKDGTIRVLFKNIVC